MRATSQKLELHAVEQPGPFHEAGQDEVTACSVEDTPGFTITDTHGRHLADTHDGQSSSSQVDCDHHGFLGIDLDKELVSFDVYEGAGLGGTAPNKNALDSAIICLSDNAADGIGVSEHAQGHKITNADRLIGTRGSSPPPHAEIERAAFQLPGWALHKR